MAGLNTVNGNGQFAHCQWQWPVCTLSMAMAGLYTASGNGQFGSILPEAMPVDRECIKKEKKKNDRLYIVNGNGQFDLYIGNSNVGLYIAWSVVPLSAI